MSLGPRTSQSIVIQCDQSRGGAIDRAAEIVVNQTNYTNQDAWSCQRLNAMEENSPVADATSKIMDPEIKQTLEEDENKIHKIYPLANVLRDPNKGIITRSKSNFRC